MISDGEWEKSGAREAFERAKKVLSNAPVLHNPDWSREFADSRIPHLFIFGIPICE